MPQTELWASLSFLARGTVTVAGVLTGEIQNKGTKDVPRANADKPLRNRGRAPWGQTELRDCAKAMEG